MNLQVPTLNDKNLMTEVQQALKAIHSFNDDITNQVRSENEILLLIIMIINFSSFPIKYHHNK